MYNKKFLICYFLGLTIIILDLIKNIKLQNQNNLLLSYHTSKSYLQYYPLSVYNSYIGVNIQSVLPYIFYHTLPLICSIPTSTILNHKLNCDIYKCTSKDELRKHIISKFGIAFLSGSALCGFLLISSFLLTAMFIPIVAPEMITGYFSIAYKPFLGEFYFNHPMLYILIYSAIDIILCGIFSVMSISSNFFLDYRISTLLFPSSFLYIIEFLCKKSNCLHYSPISFMQQSQNVCNLNIKIFILELLSFILFIFFTLVYGVNKTSKEMSLKK